LVDLIILANAQVDAFRRIPELVAALGGNPELISAYIDRNPDYNSWSQAVYQMPPGSILVIWQETLFAEGEMEAWTHRFQYFIRARRGDSALTLVEVLVNGVPDPGDGMRWRFCPLMDGVLPTQITEIARLTDSEGIDYYAVTTATNETGDA
jgi:hypothetical protein